MTGAFFRVKRGEQWENVEIEYLTESELVTALAEKDQQYLISAVSLLCKIIARIEPLFLDLAEKGIIEKASEPQISSHNPPDNKDNTDE